jgi:hypothetical protein
MTLTKEELNERLSHDAWQGLTWLWAFALPGQSATFTLEMQLHEVTP